MFPTQHRLLGNVLNRILDRIADRISERIEARLQRSVSALQAQQRSEAGRALAKKRWDDNGGRELVTLTPEAQLEEESLIEFNRRRRGF